jgi:diguanylate cyclase (GGDEF)-like protein/PAS domain S-box-containing protein
LTHDTSTGAPLGRRLANLVAEHTTNGVIITDPAGRTIWLNREIERISGYSASELIGRKPGELLQGPESAADAIELMHTAIARCQPFETTIANYAKNGLIYWIQIACRPFYGKDGTIEGFISTQVDITRLIRLADFNTLHAAVNHLIASSTDDTALFQPLCDLAVRHAHLELAWLGTPDAAGRFRILASAGQARAYLEGIEISTDAQLPQGQGPAGHTWRDGQPRFNQSFVSSELLKPWRARARLYNLDATAALPISRGGKIWGVFTVYHARSGIFDHELRETLTQLARDISQGLDRIDLRNRERELAHQLYQERELARVSLASIEDGVLTATGSGVITFLNAKASELTGWAAGAAISRPTQEVLRIYRQGAVREFRNIVDEVIASRQTLQLVKDNLLERQDGSTLFVEGCASPMFFENGALRGCVVVFRDVSAARRALETLEWQANHDPLTGLTNRFALERHLREAIATAKVRGRGLAIGLLDLDDFKPVNDQFGHQAGDQLLQDFARRLQERMRPSDLLARLAGDELVVVISDLDLEALGPMLERTLERLHQVVETPFTLGSGEQISINMSMGVAVYPGDGEDADGLLRQADAAMYAAKANKYHRETWWRPAMLALARRAQDEPLDPYGSTAGDLLAKATSVWMGLESHFVDLFYERLATRPGASRVFSLLNEAELARLKQQQAEHMRRLTSPNLRQTVHARISKHIGEIHAMMGLEASDLMGALDEYGRMLRYASQKLPWRVDARLALDSIMQSRLTEEIQLQNAGRDAIEQSRVLNMAQLEAGLQQWTADGNLGQQVVAHLCKIPCVNGALIGRPDERDEFVLEFQHGFHPAPTFGSEPPASPSDDLMREISAEWRKSWLSGQIVVKDRITPLSHPQAPMDVNKNDEPRSVACVPILDAQGHALVLLCLFGNFPGQFSHALTHMWLESIQHMIGPAYVRTETVGMTPIDSATRQHYHDLLFRDQLQIVVQPIVQLSNGEVVKIEVLARLRDGEQLLSPAAFLPSFAKQELQVLFRKGLQQTVQWLSSWEREGLTLAAGLNLPPSVLVLPECARWLEQALAAGGIPAHRLFLELLETEADSGISTQRDAAISRLATLGVQLVMDDLGSGYSSLQRMRTLPFAGVKIERDLVRDAATEPTRTVPFIGSLIRMAQSIGLEVVVEGLESAEMLDMAARLGANYGQGYAIAKPMLPEALVGWVGEWRASAQLSGLDTALGRLASSFR